MLLAVRSYVLKDQSTIRGIIFREIQAVYSSREQLVPSSQVFQNTKPMFQVEAAPCIKLKPPSSPFFWMVLKAIEIWASVDAADGPHLCERDNKGKCRRAHPEKEWTRNPAFADIRLPWSWSEEVVLQSLILVGWRCPTGIQSSSMPSVWNFALQSVRGTIRKAGLQKIGVMYDSQVAIMAFVGSWLPTSTGKPPPRHHQVPVHIDNGLTVAGMSYNMLSLFCDDCQSSSSFLDDSFKDFGIDPLIKWCPR
jgi:hypothetical protein